MPAPRLLLPLLAALALVASGCGGSDGEAPAAGQEGSEQSVAGGGGGNELSASDAADVLGARRTIDDRCGGTRANTPEGQDVPAAVQTLVTITQLYPEEVYETGSEDRAEQMREVARKVGDQLRACGIADEADRLARAADATS